MGDYSRECNRLNVPQVVFMDKKDVTDFFTGVTNDSRMIEASRRAETLIRKADLKTGRPVHMQDSAIRKRDDKAEEKKG
jgi:Zn-finger domain-containing protein